MPRGAVGWGYNTAMVCSSHASGEDRWRVEAASDSAPGLSLGGFDANPLAGVKRTAMPKGKRKVEGSHKLPDRSGAGISSLSWCNGSIRTSLLERGSR